MPITLDLFCRAAFIVIDIISIIDFRHYCRPRHFITPFHYLLPLVIDSWFQSLSLITWADIHAVPIGYYFLPLRLLPLFTLAPFIILRWGAERLSLRLAEYLHTITDYHCRWLILAIFRRALPMPLAPLIVIISSQAIGLRHYFTFTLNAIFDYMGPCHWCFSDAAAITPLLSLPFFFH